MLLTARSRSCDLVCSAPIRRPFAQKSFAAPYMTCTRFVSMLPSKSTARTDVNRVASGAFGFSNTELA